MDLSSLFIFSIPCFAISSFIVIGYFLHLFNKEKHSLINEIKKS